MFPQYLHLIYSELSGCLEYLAVELQLGHLIIKIVPIIFSLFSNFQLPQF